MHLRLNRKSKGQSRETGNIGYTSHKMKTNPTKNTIYLGHHYAQAKTNNVK
jgi:hypothetical protein